MYMSAAKYARPRDQDFRPIDMSEPDIEDTTSDKGFLASVGPAFGYKYLGPGTDLAHHKRYDVQPTNALDRGAYTHDYAYNKIKQDLLQGKITYDEAFDAVDRADAGLAWDSAKDFYKGVPGVVKDVYSAYNAKDPVKLVGSSANYAKMLPSALTSSAMQVKWLLSKLGIGRGSFAGLPKRAGWQKNEHNLRVASRRARIAAGSQYLSREQRRLAKEFPNSWGRVYQT